MTDSAQRALNYRDRAKELRAIAEALSDEEQRTLLHDVADQYEKMASRFLGLVRVAARRRQTAMGILAS
jgi:hypothetical protein